MIGSRVVENSAVTAGRMTRKQALASPALVGAFGLAGAGLLHFRDPHVQGSYGFCPFNALTGLYCPGCGGTRAVNDLTNLDFGAAISGNVLAVGVAVTLIVAYVRWIPKRWRGEDARMIVLPANIGVTLLVVMAVFAVVRNTPWGAWLAP